MRYFVTGASGWIGTATVAALHAAGHEVIGLARSSESAAAIESTGARAHRGSLEDLASLQAGAAQADGVVHLGYHHDFSDMPGAARIDRAAIDALGAELAGSERPLLIASGLLGLANDRPGTEDDHADAASHPRVANANAALALRERGVRPIVVRFAATVHGAGDHGFVAAMAGFAREHGASRYVGDGRNRWPAVHVSDAARLVALALDRAPAGSVLHAVAEEGVAIRDVAEAIGRGLGLPTTSIEPDRAAEHFSWLAAFVGADIPASSTRTRALLDWEPVGPSLLDDLEAGYYTGEPAN